MMLEELFESLHLYGTLYDDDASLFPPRTYVDHQM